MKKIMFNDEYGLTQAVLERRKTQTRRIVHGLPSDVEGLEITSFMKSHRQYYEEVWVLSCHTTCRLGKMLNIPYQIGEEVAIAQSYQKVFDTVGTMNVPQLHEIPFNHKGWHNKRSVRPDIMPHIIKITKIRVERLQDISDEDCLKEGIRRGEFLNTWGEYYFKYGQNYIQAAKTPREAYVELIKRVSGKGTWDSNPWVFVYDFELIK